MVSGHMAELDTGVEAPQSGILLATDYSVQQAREVVGVFRSYQSLCVAARALYRAGFKRWHVMRDMRQEGALVGKSAAQLADDYGARRTDHVEVELLHGSSGYMIGTFCVIPGIVAAACAAANQASMTSTVVTVIIFGGGGIVLGTLISAALARQARMRLITRARRSGLVLWAHVQSPEQEATALAIFERHGGEKVRAREA